MGQTARDLWNAIGTMSRNSAVLIGSLIATWTFNVAVVAWMLYGIAVWNDRRISIATLEIDLIVIAVGVVGTRQSMAILAELKRQGERRLRRDEAHNAAVLTWMKTVDRRLQRLDVGGGSAVPERKPNRRQKEGAPRGLRSREPEAR